MPLSLTSSTLKLFADFDDIDELFEQVNHSCSSIPLFHIQQGDDEQNDKPMKKEIWHYAGSGHHQNNHRLSTDLYLST